MHPGKSLWRRVRRRTQTVLSLDAFKPLPSYLFYFLVFFSFMSSMSRIYFYSNLFSFGYLEFSIYFWEYFIFFLYFLGFVFYHCRCYLFTLYFLRSYMCGFSFLSPRQLSVQLFLINTGTAYYIFCFAARCFHFASVCHIVFWWEGFYFCFYCFFFICFILV